MGHSHAHRITRITHLSSAIPDPPQTLRSQWPIRHPQQWPQPQLMPEHCCLGLRGCERVSVVCELACARQTEEGMGAWMPPPACTLEHAVFSLPSDMDVGAYGCVRLM